jgi:agmatine deiminase
MQQQQKTLMPAEWTHQDAVMLTWPHAQSDWLPWLDLVEQTFVVLANEIRRREPLIISCYDESHRQHVQALLKAADKATDCVAFFVVPSNDTWARDHGPITVYRQGSPVLLDFGFNGWGDKFAWQLDDQITVRLHQAGAFGKTPLETIHLVLEGGSIETDGQGTLLTTRQCLLSHTRNGLTQTALEQRLKEELGVHRFLWLQHGYLLGDDTDGHIDTLARFCDPHTIVYQSCNNKTDPHYPTLRAMKQELAAFRTVTGEPYRLVSLPLPNAQFNESGERLPAGYANFLIVNGAVLMPTYNDPADDLALGQLKNCFPDRQVVGIDSSSLIQQGGSLHCVTMQLPAGILKHFPKLLKGQ